MKKVFVVCFLVCFLLTGCGAKEENQNEQSNKLNDFFFPMEGNETALTVYCEMNMIGSFCGNGTLVIRQLPDAKLDGFYEMILTDLNGQCDEHADINDAECEYSSDFPIGYFYVDAEKIYMMPHDTGYLDIFSEVETFPPTEEYITARAQEMQERGEHYGYFDYRLVCAQEGKSDTFTEDNHYHEFISVEDDERHYNFYPEEIEGTQEYLYITWKQGIGIARFDNWSGNLKNHIVFWIQETEKSSGNT